jgi:hypothetical protein
MSGVEPAMEGAMKEYSLAELLDHPGLGLFLIDDGMDRRCVDLVLDVGGRVGDRSEAMPLGSPEWNPLRTGDAGSAAGTF